MKRFFRFYKNRYQISTKKNMFSNKLFMKPLKHIKTVGKNGGEKNVWNALSEKTVARKEKTLKMTNFRPKKVKI